MERQAMRSSVHSFRKVLKRIFCKHLWIKTLPTTKETLFSGEVFCVNCGKRRKLWSQYEKDHK